MFKLIQNFLQAADVFVETNLFVRVKLVIMVLAFIILLLIVTFYDVDGVWWIKEQIRKRRKNRKGR